MAGTNTLGNILLVDDDKNITEMLSFNLASEGFGVSIVPLAKDVPVERLGNYRLVIADAMDQPFNGIQLIAAIKEHKQNSALPVVMYTMLEGEDVIIEAFDNGAEDFVSKPFSLRELIARIKAILRRHPIKVQAPTEHQTIDFPEMGLSIDLENQKVTVDDAVVPLTKTEYSILVFLIQNHNAFFTRADICKEVWKEDASSNIRIVDTNISRLRKKLGESGKYIINRYGMGYAFVDKVMQ